MERRPIFSPPSPVEPDRPEVQNFLGYGWVNRGEKVNEGMDLIRKAVAARPDQGYIVDSLGWAHFALGEYREAVETLERAAELSPSDPEIVDHLGDAYWRTGRETEAAFEWRRALELDPDVERETALRRQARHAACRRCGHVRSPTQRAMNAVPGRSNFTTAWAPAKVNLYLHVGPPGAGRPPSGRQSRRVRRHARGRPHFRAGTWPQLTLTVEGPGAKALRHAPNNLYARRSHGAARCVRPHRPRRRDLTLHKELPIAGGVGGGSADAAATLHVLNDMWGIEFGEAALERLATQLGSDVPACVRSRPLVMRGTGERLHDVAAPDLPAVLVNPGVTLETRRKVFERFDELGAKRSSARSIRRRRRMSRTSCRP